jgi:hypothetical protein
MVTPFRITSEKAADVWNAMMKRKQAIYTPSSGWIMLAYDILRRSFSELSF